MLKIFLFFIFILSNSTVYCQTTKSLDDYLTAAAGNSPLLNDFNNQVYSLKLDSLKFLAGYGFIVTGEGSASYAPVRNGWGYDGALSNGHPVTAVVRGSKEFISKNNMNARLAGFYLNMKQVQAQSKLNLLQLNRNITNQYIATYASQEQFAVTEEVIHLLEQEDIVLKKLTQAAVFKQTDYLSFKVTLQQNQLALQQRRAEWYNNFSILNYMAGLIDTLPQHLIAPDFGTLQITPFEESVYAENFIADSLKLANEATIIHYDYKPKVTAFGDGGFQSTLMNTPYKNIGFSAGVNISLPIYDGKKRQMLLKQNRIALQTKSKYLDFAHNQYTQQVAGLNNQISQYREMIITANEQLRYSRALIEANAKQLPTGDVKVVDFILSISNYINLKSGLVQYQGNLYNLYSQLHYLIIP